MIVLNEKVNFDIKNSLLPIFARHETFHPRFGWLKKGYDKAKEDRKIFSSDQASIALGVGKNMVKAIKYWCLVFKILEEKREGNNSFLNITDFAEKLLDNDGWDPYLENPASLWLLHWQLFKPTCHAPAWFFTFNNFKHSQFNTLNLLSELKDFQNNYFENSIISDSSLNKDINCILRMYNNRSNVTLNEDSINSPFNELNLISEVSNGSYMFNIGHKTNLPSEIIVYACLDFANLYEKGAKTISISRLLYEISSPGLLFKLSESALYEALDEVASKHSEIKIINSSGLIQLSYDFNPEELSLRILDNYYTKG